MLSRAVLCGLLRKQFQEQWPREWKLLSSFRKFFFMVLLFQYFHLIAVRVASFLAIPREPLWDMWFALLPDPNPDQLRRLSTVLQSVLVVGTLLFVVSPLVLDYSRTQLRRALSSTVILVRVASVLVLAQTLRTATFLATLLPGPEFDCRPDSPAYRPTASLLQIIAPPGMGPSASPYDSFSNHCVSDLVFSSRALIALLCALTWTHYAWPRSEETLRLEAQDSERRARELQVYGYPVEHRSPRESGIRGGIEAAASWLAEVPRWGPLQWLVAGAWGLAAAVGVLSVLARQHYSLDVFVAFYATPLVWLAFGSFVEDVPLPAPLKTLSGGLYSPQGTDEASGSGASPLSSAGSAATSPVFSGLPTVFVPSTKNNNEEDEEEEDGGDREVQHRFR